MRTVQNGNIIQIFDNSVTVGDSIPSSTFKVGFSPNKGFFLESLDEDIFVNHKIYGSHEEKANKVIKRFAGINKNCGVLLSGNKGIGKTTTAKLIAQKGLENGYPVILATEYIPGISDFLQSIKQECIIIFDEYDKTFNTTQNKNSTQDANTEMLTLFDGVQSSKKLFVITCNNLRNISEFLIARPGRILYHFKFNVPQRNEVKEYLEDKLNEDAKKYLQDVVRFALKTSLNFDCLEAIVFELNEGESFVSAIADLNILEPSEDKYIVSLHLENKVLTADAYFNIFEGNKCYVDFYHDGVSATIEFYPVDAMYDETTDVFTVPSDKFSFGPRYDEMDSDETRTYNALFGEDGSKVMGVTFTRFKLKSIPIHSLIA